MQSSTQICNAVILPSHRKRTCPTHNAHGVLYSFSGESCKCLTLELALKLFLSNPLTMASICRVIPSSIPRRTTQTVVFWYSVELEMNRYITHIIKSSIKLNWGIIEFSLATLHECHACQRTASFATKFSMKVCIPQPPSLLSQEEV